MGLLGVLLFPLHLVYAGVYYLFEWGLVSGAFGYGFGTFLGLIIGYFAFIFTLPPYSEKSAISSSLTGENGEVDNESLKRLLPEMPAWVKNPDYDRVDWINTVVREMWPYIDKAVDAQVQAIVPPLIAQYKPAALESIAIDTMTLGSLPPTIAGVKVYDTPDNEMIIEPVVKWAGNPNIIVSAKAVGVKATVQLVDLTVFATARVTLKPLVPVFPCFSRISVSLMSKPTVDFGLKVIGGDLMAIPGLYNFVQETIKNMVSDLMLWPKTFEVYSADDGSGLKKPVGWLYVRKLAAKNLKNIERFGKSDPYVKLSLGNKMGQKITSVKYGNLNPEWISDEFKLLVRDHENQVLEFQLFDKDEIGKDKPMSVQRFPLKELESKVPKRITLELAKDLKDLQSSQEKSSKSLGQITAELTYKKFLEEEDSLQQDESNGEESIPDTLPPGGGLLRVTVHSGESLEGKNNNPYVEVRFRDVKKKTKVMKKATDCEFDEPPFEFLVEEPPKDEKLYVHVWGKNLTPVFHVVSSKENLGHVTIPLSDVVTNGRINDFFPLDESKNGKLKIELEWIEKKQPSGPSSEEGTTKPGENE